jgi:hypothetical protein
MAHRLNDIHESALRDIGLGDDEFKGCMVKFGSDRRLIELVVQSQQNQEALKEKYLRK